MRLRPLFSFRTDLLPSTVTLHVASYKTKAKIAQRTPFPVAVEAGKSYFYCTCGASKKQPFCDGSHKAFNIEHGTNFVPTKFVANESDTIYFCGCKQSDGPLCDGSHATLPAEN